MLGIIRQHVWLGSGLGSFAEVFPAHRPLSVSPRGVWETAHSTYLQVLIEGGLVSLIAMVVPLGCALAAFLGSAMRRSPDDLAPIAGFTILLMPSLHAMVDFQMQTAGYFIPLLITVGFLFARSAKGLTTRRRVRRTRDAPTVPAAIEGSGPARAGRGIEAGLP
jgi:O-antigen ligase